MAVNVLAELPEIIGVQVSDFNGAQAPWPLYVVPHGVNARVLSIRYRADGNPTPPATRAWVFEYLDLGGNVIFQLVPASGPPIPPVAAPFTLESFGLGIPLYQTGELNTPGTDQIAENSGLPDLWLADGYSLRFNSIPVGDAADKFSGVYLVVQQEGASALSVEVPVYLVPEPMVAA